MLNELAAKPEELEENKNLPITMTLDIEVPKEKLLVDWIRQIKRENPKLAIRTIIVELLDELRERLANEPQVEG